MMYSHFTDYTCNTWYKNVEDIVLIRKADLENHNRSGGHWVVFNKKVYDVQETRYLFLDYYVLYFFLK